MTDVEKNAAAGAEPPMSPRSATTGQEVFVDSHEQQHHHQQPPHSPVGTATTTEGTTAAPAPGTPPAANVSRESQNSAASTIAPETAPPVASEKNGGVRHPREGWPKWKWPLVAFLNCIFFLLIGYDVGNIANIQAPIYQRFGQLQLLPWVALGYVAINVATVFTIRKLLAVCNMRWQVPVYASLMFCGSAVAASASTIDAVIIGRCITGLGGAGVFQCVLTYILVCTTAEEFVKFTGLLASSWAVGLILGPIIGAGFADNDDLTWRWAMYINLPIIGVVMAIAMFGYPNVIIDPHIRPLDRAKNFDYIGSFLYFSSIILFFSCLMFSGGEWPWEDGSTIAAWCIAGGVFLIVLVQQGFKIFTTKENRLIPMDLFKIRPFILTAIGTSGIGATYGIGIYYTPLFYAFVHGMGPTQCAVRLLPFTGTFVGCSLIGAGLLPRIRYFAPYYIAAGSCIAIGAGLLTRIDPSTSESEVMGLSALVGAGAGMAWSIGSGVMTQVVPLNRRLDATAVFITFQIAGIAFALAIAASVYRNMGFDLITDALKETGAVVPPQEVRELMAGVAAGSFDNMPQEARDAAVKAVTDMISRFYWMLVAAGLTSLVTGCLMPFKPLSFYAEQNKAKAEENPNGHIDLRP